jgi:hypothetical protein
MPLIFVLAASLVVNCYGFTSGLTKTWSFARSLQSFDHLAVLKATSSKQRVIDIFSPQSTESTESFQLEEVLACPETLNPLTFGQRFYGFAEESFLEEPDFEKKYKRVQLPGGSGYWDMTIKSEINKPLWQQSNRERIGQSFFQNPIIRYVFYVYVAHCITTVMCTSQLLSCI